MVIEQRVGEPIVLPVEVVVVIMAIVRTVGTAAMGLTQTRILPHQEV